MLWLSRIGKLLAFLAGTTIVLDALGSERIIAWGEQIKKPPGFARSIFFIYASGAMSLVGIIMFLGMPWWAPCNESLNPFIILGSAIMILGGVFVLVKFPDLVVSFGRLLANSRFESWLRAIAVPLFFLGFALDYLAS